jgi:hypothetical protein
LLYRSQSGHSKRGRSRAFGWLTNSVIHTPNVEAFPGRDARCRLSRIAPRVTSGGRTEGATSPPWRPSCLLSTSEKSLSPTVAQQQLPPPRRRRRFRLSSARLPVSFVEGQRIVGSLRRPGGNVHRPHQSRQGTELYGKRLDLLLREAVPGLSRVAVVWSPTNQGAPAGRRAVETAAKTLGTRGSPNRGFGHAAVGAWARQGTAESVGGNADHPPMRSFGVSERKSVSLAARHRLPAIYPEHEFATDGGLMAYGIRDVGELPTRKRPM